MGRVRVEPRPGLTVDVFVVHTVAGDGNKDIREKQTKEMVTFVNGSDADFAVLGGDFNVDPEVTVS